MNSTMKMPMMKMTVLAVSAVALTACGQGFKTTSAESSASSSTSNGSQGTVIPSDTAWKDLAVDGTVSGGTYGDNPVVGIDKEKKELIVRFPMLVTPILIGNINLPIPQIPGARLSMEPTPSGGQTLALRIPLDKVLRGIDFLEPSRLPNGDPIPAVPDGELPSAAVTLTRSSTKVTVYLAPTIVGLYVDAPFDPMLALTLPIKNKAKTKTWGYFSTIPAKRGVAPGGFFLSVKLPDDIARIIDDVL